MNNSRLEIQQEHSSRVKKLKTCGFCNDHDVPCSTPPSASVALILAQQMQVMEVPTTSGWTEEPSTSSWETAWGAEVSSLDIRTAVEEVQRPLFLCPFRDCYYKTNAAVLFGRHKRMHYNSKNQKQCRHCKRYFISKSTLLSHLQNMHPEIINRRELKTRANSKES